MNNAMQCKGKRNQGTKDAHANFGECYDCCITCNYSLHICRGCGEDLNPDGTEYIKFAVNWRSISLLNNIREEQLQGPRYMHSDMHSDRKCCE